MTDHNRPIRTVSEELDILGRHPVGTIPEVPQEFLDIFVDEYSKPETKLGRQALELIQDDEKRNAANSETQSKNLNT